MRPSSTAARAIVWTWLSCSACAVALVLVACGGGDSGKDAGSVEDLASAPDLTPPCGVGLKRCKAGAACIDAADCCLDTDCKVSGQTCQPDGSCLCPAGRKPCDTTCIEEAGCCGNSDCTVMGQSCQIDHSCQCPSGQKVCGNKCIPQANCCTGDDCPSKVCVEQMCQLAACDDKVQNGMESDVDCGGGFCPGCASGMKCAANVDCMTNVCAANKCK